MSDGQYIDALKTFTGALEEIVKTLEEQNKKDNDDVIINFFKTPMGNLTKAVDELKTITDNGFKSLINSNSNLISKIENSIKNSGTDIGTMDLKNAVITLTDSTNQGFINLNDSNLKIIDAIKKLKSTDTESISDDLNLNLKNLKETVEKIKTDDIIIKIEDGNKEIKKLIEQQKEQKETGMLDKVGNTKNKEKIVDGIKTVILIAGGVLALGMAFKIIGTVDFLSVIALSTGMLIMSKTYSEISQLKNMKYAEIFKVGLILPVIASSLTISAWILKAFPKISVGQVISMIIVGGGLGVAALLLLESVNKSELDKTKIKTMFLLPLVLPVIALSLTLSAWIIKAFPIIGLGQIISFTIVGASIGIAAYFLLKAINKIDFGKTKLINILLLPLILPAIALSLTLSAYILKAFPIIGLGQIISFTIVGASIGIAAYFLLKAINKIDFGKTKLINILLLPLILPAIALSLTLSAYILKAFPIINFNQGLSILFVGATIGITTWLLLKALGKFKNDDLDVVLLLPIILPMVAYGLTTSSIILQSFEPIKKPLQFLLSSAAIGLAMLIMTPTISMMGKMSFKDIAQGVLAIPFIASAIVAAAYIFRELPDNMIYPEFMWTLGAGLSFLVFTPVILFVGKMSLKDAAMGAIAIPIIALSILATAFIFQSLPEKMKYPEIKWTLGTGLSILAFGGIAIAMGLLLTGPQALAAALGLVGILAISATVVAVSNILKKGDYSNYPDIKWASGVGLSLLAFSLASVAALAGGAANMIGKFFTGGTDPLVALAQRMVNVANKLNEVNWDSSNYPKKEYAEGVGGLLLAFAEVFAKISKVEGFNSIVSKLFGGNSDSFTKFIENSANAMNTVRDTLKGDWTKVGYPTKEYAEGVGTFLESLANSFSAISKISFKYDQSFTIFAQMAAEAMNTVRDTLKGDWTKVGYPTKEYAEGVGTFLESLANSFSAISKISFKYDQSFTIFAQMAAEAMVAARNELNKVEWTKSNYPKKEYSDGVGTFLLAMAESYSKLNSGGILKLFGGSKQTLTEFVKEVSTAMVEASNILSGGTYSNIIDKKYIESFGYLISEIRPIVNKEFNISDNFSSFSTNIASAIAKASVILNDGKYDNIPKESYTEAFSYFVIAISDLMKNEFNLANTNKFIVFSVLVAPAIKKWINTISASDFKSVPTDKYTSNFVHFVKNVGNMITDWNSLKLRIEDLTTFDKSMTMILGSINTLSKMPDIKDSMVKNMEKLKDTMTILSNSINLFMYETPSGGWQLIKGFFVGKDKRDMNQFSLFANGLATIISSLSVLSTLSPMPDGIIKGYQNFLSELSKMPDMSTLDPKIESINKLANSFATLAASLESLNNNMGGISDLSKGLFLISIIDDKKFDNVLKSVDKYKTTLQVVGQVPSEQANLLATVQGLYETINKKEETAKTSTEIKPDITDQTNFYNNVVDIKNILIEFKDLLEIQSKLGGFRDK